MYEYRRFLRIAVQAVLDVQSPSVKCFPLLIGSVTEFKTTWIRIAIQINSIPYQDPADLDSPFTSHKTMTLYDRFRASGDAL